MNSRHPVATKDVRLSGAIIHIDEYSGKAVKIERYHRKL
jgi:calcineurin-like phosphoesterase